MPRILIGPNTLTDIDAEYRDVLRNVGFDFVFPPRSEQMTENELLDRLTGCEAALAGSEPYTKRVLSAHPQLRIVARSGVGYDSVDVAAATELGIPVTIAPGNAEGVAEHTLGLMLALAKGFLSQHQSIAKGHWPRYSNRPVRGTTLAIAGLGRIGKEVAKLGRAFGMTVIACDIVPDIEFAKTNGIELCTFEELFVRGDTVTLHLPLSKETRHCVDAKILATMKPTAFLINTARGSIVDEPALYEVLKAGRIAGAGLDVFEKEPPAADNPILQLPNVVQTAHTAGVDTRSRDNMALRAAKCVAEFWTGGWPEGYVVNPAVRERLKHEKRT